MRFALAIMLCAGIFLQTPAHAVITLPSSAPAPTSASGSAGNGLVFLRYTVPTPSGVAATQASTVGKVTISWTAGDTATKYEVYRGTTLATNAGGVSGTSFDDTGVSGITPYTYTVVAKADGGISGASSTATGYAAIDTSSWSVTATDGTITGSVSINWGAITGASGYYVQRDGATIATINSGATVTYSDARLGDPAVHIYTVIPFNANGSNTGKSDSGYANVAPTALSDSITTHMDVASAGIAPTVTDANPLDTFTFTITSQPAHGAATISSNKVIYTPTTSYQGTDSFTVTATDKGGATISGPIAVLVNCPDFATGWNVSASDGTITGSVALAWTNVYCAQGYVVKRGVTTIGTINSGATVSLTDSLPGDPTVYTYTVTPFNVGGNGTAKTDTGYANVVPTALTGSITTHMDTASVGVAPTVTDANPSDIFTFTIATQPTHGAATIASNKVVYTPATSYQGTDSFTVTATDKGGATITGPLSVLVNCTDFATGWTVSATDGTVTGSVALAWTSVYCAQGYVVKRDSTTIATINNGATVTLSDPLPGDPTVYTYTVTPFNVGGNGTAKTDTGFANVVPTALVGSITTHMDTPSAGIAPTVTDANPSDTFTFTVATQPSNGTATIASNRVVYTPTASYQGTDSFTVTATDKGGATVTGPIAVLVNCTDLGSAWTVSATDGTITDNVTITWPAVYCAQGFVVKRDSTTIATINNGGLLRTFIDSLPGDPTVHTYTVTPFNLGGNATAKTDTGYANVAPTALEGSINAVPLTPSDPLTPTVSDANMPISGETFIFTIATQPSNGTASITANQVVYTSSASAGNDSFSVTATDKAGAPVTGTISVVVACPGPGIIGLDFDTTMTQLIGAAQVSQCGSPSTSMVSINVSQVGSSVLSVQSPLTATLNTQLFTFGTAIGVLSNGAYGLLVTLTDAYNHTATYNGTLTVDWLGQGNVVFTNNGISVGGSTTTPSFGFIGVQ